MPIPNEEVVAWPKPGLEAIPPNAPVVGCEGAGVDVAPNPNDVPAGCAVPVPNEPNPVVAGLGAPNVLVVEAWLNEKGVPICVGCAVADGAPNAFGCAAPKAGVDAAAGCPNVVAGVPNAFCVAGWPNMEPAAGWAVLFMPCCCWFCWPKPPNEELPNMAAGE